MTVPTADDLTGLRTAIEAYEDIVSKAVEKRLPQRKSFWESTGLASAATAVLTVLITSIAGYCTQASLRTDDTAAQLDRGALEGERTVLAESSELAYEAMHYADERRHLIRKDYALTVGQENDLIDSVNAWDSRWRRGREKFRVSLAVRYGTESPVAIRWDSLVTRVDDYSRCALTKDCTDWVSSRKAATDAASSFRTVAVMHVRDHEAALRAGKTTH